MSQRMEHLEPVLNELERYGLKGEVGERGKHLEIRWNTPNGERFIIMPKTPSDWRGALNSRSDLRKLLRADNMQPKPISELTFQKAMSLPKPVSITREQFLQNDVDALADLVFELQSRLSDMQAMMTALHDKVSSARVVSYIQYGEDVKSTAPEAQAAPTSDMPPFRPGTKSSLLYSVLTYQFKDVKDIARESGIPVKHAAVILWKAKLKGYVEKGLRGNWRRKS